MKIHEHG